MDDLANSASATAISARLNAQESVRTEMSAASVKLSDDLLRGAMAIAELLFGERSTRARRKVFHLAKTSRLPTFKLGSTICMRRSVFFAWLAQQEQANTHKK
jgi:hypothetical protein